MNNLTGASTDFIPCFWLRIYVYPGNVSCTEFPLTVLQNFHIECKTVSEEKVMPANIEKIAIKDDNQKGLDT